MPIKLNQPIPKVDWPQDHLRVPSGLGQFPGIDARNKDVTRSEFFLSSAQFDAWDGLTTQSKVMASPIDGDLWITGICCVAFNSNNSVDVRQNWPINITDILSDYELFNPFIPYSMLRLPIDLMHSPASQFRSVENLPAPYPLLRRGGLRIKIGPNYYPPVNTPITLYFAFAGWKEYANAAV